MMNYSNYLYIAIRAALDAGKSIMDIYTDPKSDFGIERKADNSPLTIADKAAHRLISNALSVTPFPVLSEEGAEISYEERSKWDIFWIVDPLDGTKEFIKRNGEFTVNIALVSKGIPVLGVIYVPARKELYFAADAAYKLTDVDSSNQPSMDELKQNAIRLPVSIGHQGVVVVASRSHQSEETTNYIENLRKQGKPVTLISSGSSLKICLVAEGSADVYPRFAPTMEWDTAAGHAIAIAAGCNIYLLDEKTPIHYNKEDLHNPWFIVK
ncbi:3'(2'),5'-bisphosphate nucleotidase CysQ [Parabacteroides chinchillae]|uniref:3'(2'),5'-bisphosphate nucleotidase CysQ n=1 Tax=Parabacteroides chinchillae TaxID=871327 RepID=A0A8G2BYK9_9BACT|nr:3'(2'),5'-bisphosphate nucleotidase CysQ [Parabacteroides chinchillae]SEG20776.1 3'(2'),5'-bisphosphate nucleotidase [Parabacteroides chinchillae]